MRGATVKAPPAEGAEDEVQITELEKISPTRVDGVGTPANGFPILMMKSLPADAGEQSPAKPARTRPAGVLSKGKRAEALELVKGVLDGTIPVPVLAKDAAGYDESADIAGALEVIRQISLLVCSEATALGTGRLEEIWDIATLMDALCAMKCFLIAERSQDDGSGDAATGQPMGADAGINGAVSYKCKSAKSVYAKLRKSVDDAEVWPDGTLRKFVSADQRKQYAEQGVAMPNGDFPIPDKGHLKSAVGHYGGYKGDKAAAKKHITKRAKALGLTSLLPDDWTGGGTKTGKGAMLPGSGENTSSKAAGSTSTTDVIKKAVAEATAASEERINTLEAQLAKVLATPIPGGPLLVTPLTQRPAANPAALKADRLRAIAAQTSDPSVATAYRELAAREERGASITKD